jgi:hypothetical protein
MHLPKETAAFFHWQYQVIKVFLRVRLGPTLGLITALGAAKITRLLAFMLPLKVVLLAGSGGVPRYFQFFVHPDDKTAWIIGLTGAAFVCYFATLALEAFSTRIAHDVSSDILQEAGVVSKLSNQTEDAQSYYEKFCQISAHLLFALTGLLALALFNTWLFTALVMLFVIQFIFSAWLVRGENDLHPGRFKAYVFEKLKNYLGILSSINFLAAFLVILVPFLISDKGNILVAIGSIIITRQMLGSLVATVSNANSLSKNRHRIDPLVFRDFYLEEPEAKEGQTLRNFFHKQAREHSVAEVLKSVVQTDAELEVKWEDSTLKGINTFVVEINDNAGVEARYYQMQVFPPNMFHQLENEEFLFRQIPKSCLNAPEVLVRFAEGPFECQICQYGEAKPMSLKEWNNAWPGLLQQTWACSPPKTLVKAYEASTPLLHKRLNQNLIKRLDIALDNTDELSILEQFSRKLPEIRQILMEMPIYIHNEDFQYKNIIPVKESQSYYIMSWRNWSIEPIGVWFPKNVKEDQLTGMLEHVRSFRSDIPKEFGYEHVMLASKCWQMERNIKRGAYKLALDVMQQILKSQIFTNNAARKISSASYRN